MRELHVHASAGEREEVASILDEYDIDYTVVSDEGEGALFFFPLPTAMVGPILDEFRDADIEEDAYTVSTKAELAETPNFTELRQRFSDSIHKLSKSELHAKIREMQWPYQLYYLGTLLSVIAEPPPGCCSINRRSSWRDDHRAAGEFGPRRPDRRPSG
ncbi:hypothetical protein [Haladaptatus sp. R4]|uniref:hypothetical protein n=1 Tax=Haladaptatus sp. R4 TaxID=1679489 RepID=UPI001CBD33D0|nr:hypothetical protein [Haladaptatus sp. R4]